MKRTFQNGFTLVELLITISIIGVLASIILTSLNDARGSAVTAKIQTEMDAIAKRASIEQMSSLTYDTVCGSNGMATSTTIVNLLTSINTLASSTVICNSDTTAYAISVPINTVHWCVDNVGRRKEIPNPLSQVAGFEEYACP